MATVRADVVEGAQHVVATPHDDDAFTDHLTGDVGILFSDFAAVTDADPALGEDRFLLVLEHRGLGVEIGRKGEGYFRVGAEVDGQAFEIVHGSISVLLIG